MLPVRSAAVRISFACSSVRYATVTMSGPSAPRAVPRGVVRETAPKTRSPRSRPGYDSEASLRNSVVGACAASTRRAEPTPEGPTEMPSDVGIVHLPCVIDDQAFKGLPRLRSPNDHAHGFPLFNRNMVPGFTPSGVFAPAALERWHSRV